MTAYDDEFYRDLLEGLAIHSGSVLQRDVLAALSRHDEPAIGRAFNKNQVASKLWLVETLLASAGPRHPHILILGGWLGVLAAVLLHDRRFAVDRIESLDVDASCAPVATAINATHAAGGRFVATTGDMLDVDYRRSAGEGPADLVINTSCEHIAAFDRWYAAVPAGQLLVLQSNDYYAVAEHVNCVPDLAAFRAQAPLAEVLFAGARRMRRYTRFMLIGRK